MYTYGILCKIITKVDVVRKFGVDNLFFSFESYLCRKGENFIFNSHLFV